MPTYKCKINTKDGRLVEKTLNAPNKAALEEHFEKQGAFVNNIRRAEGFSGFFRTGISIRRIKMKELQIFNQEFAILIKAGLPIISALDIIIKKGSKEELKEVLEEVRRNISEGASLSEAFGNCSYTFSNLYIASLQAGEKSGNISIALTRYVDYLKRMGEIKKKIITASVYPVILLVVSIFAICFLLIYVVPSFTKTYFEAGTELPELTMMLVGLSNGVKNNIIFIIIALFLAIVCYTFLQRSENGRVFLDKIKLKIPLIGSIYAYYSLSKFTRTLKMVLHGGTPLLNALQISMGTLDNRFLQSKLKEASDEIEKGDGFSESLTQTHAFPELALSMMEAGEKSGALEQVLDDIADFYENDVDTKLSVLTSSIEPALMIVMGLLIGVIVLAMYLPIFQMASTVG